MNELAEIVVGWPLAASLAVAITARSWQSGRRRGALDEALHELRRPLQSIVLAAGSNAGPQVLAGSAQLASAALDHLERVIAGGVSGTATEVVAMQPLLESAAARWQARARLSGGSVEVRWDGGAAAVEGDRFALAQALDNLIVNAIEHGGPRVVLAADVRPGGVRMTIADSGRASRPRCRRETPVELIARLSGRGRRGHGLAIVRRTVSAHGGHFSLRRAESGSLAAIELPLAGDAILGPDRGADGREPG